MNFYGKIKKLLLISEWSREVNLSRGKRAKAFWLFQQSFLLIVGFFISAGKEGFPHYSNFTGIYFPIIDIFSNHVKIGLTVPFLMRKIRPFRKEKKKGKKKGKKKEKNRKKRKTRKRKKGEIPSKSKLKGQKTLKPTFFLKLLWNQSSNQWQIIMNIFVFFLKIKL